MNGMSFALRLKALRESRGMTARELSRRIERNSAFISQLETEKRAKVRLPSLEIMRAIAAALGVSVEELAPETTATTSGEAERRAMLVPPGAGNSSSQFDPSDWLGYGSGGARGVEDRLPLHDRPQPQGRVQFRTRSVPVLNIIDVQPPDGVVEPILHVHHRYFTRQAKRPAAYYMTDSSLRADRVLPGDYLLIDLEARQPNNGDIVLVIYEGRFLARVWQFYGEPLSLDAASPEIPSLRLGPEERRRMQIIGLFCGLFPRPYHHQPGGSRRNEEQRDDPAASETSDSPLA